MSITELLGDKNNCIILETWDYSPPKIIWALNKPTKENLNPHTVVPRFNELIRTTLIGYELIYTDDSKTAIEVGYGVFGPNLDTSRGFPKPASIFSAEAAAIFSVVTESSFSWKAIITDSAGVLKALESPKNRHPLVQAIRMASNSKTVYVWVPSHYNISGNEAADKLAAIGRSKTSVEPEVPAADLKVWIKTIIASAWNKEWANTRDPFLRKIQGDTKCWFDTKNWYCPDYAAAD